ncbi:hypothetical protein ACFSJQ_05985 [Vibrio olivae]|uniref:Uncharacterized protein n=1 Tax=Vibrio olivae TaxID=1243002 RepID=A0ABV5HJ58_9VIBR
MSRTEVVMRPMLPPAGLIVPCTKPILKATTPSVTASDDVPRLKAALSQCAQQAEDYLNWRKQREKTKRNTHD